MSQKTLKDQNTYATPCSLHLWIFPCEPLKKDSARLSVLASSLILNTKLDTYLYLHNPCPDWKCGWCSPAHHVAPKKAKCGQEQLPKPGVHFPSLLAFTVRKPQGLGWKESPALPGWARVTWGLGPWGVLWSTASPLCREGSSLPSQGRV